MVREDLWHRVTIFPAAKVARVEERVQKGSRVRLLDQIRPGSYEDNAGRAKYVVEFFVDPLENFEELARGKERESTAAA